MNHKTRKFLTAAALIGVLAAALPSQAMEASFSGRVATAAGHYITNTGGALLEQVRKEIAAGVQPGLQRLPTVVVTPSDEDLRDAGIDPKKFRAAKKVR